MCKNPAWKTGVIGRLERAHGDCFETAAADMAAAFLLLFSKEGRQVSPLLLQGDRATSMP